MATASSKDPSSVPTKSTTIPFSPRQVLPSAAPLKFTGLAQGLLPTPVEAVALLEHVRRGLDSG